MLKFLIPLLLIPAIAFAEDAEEVKEKNPADAVCLIRREPSIVKNSAGAASGFFIEDNKIVTAFHVVRRCVNEGVKLRVEYRNIIYPATILAYHENYDIAIIEAEVNGESTLDISDAGCDLGDIVSAWGHPAGMWDVYACKDCAVTSKHTMFTEDNKHVKRAKVLFNAEVRPGMSGGPLLNKDLEVVGVVIERNGNFTEGYASVLSQLRAVLDKVGEND